MVDLYEVIEFGVIVDDCVVDGVVIDIGICVDFDVIINGDWVNWIDMGSGLVVFYWGLF